MYNGHRIAVVIPVLNEEQSIGKVLSAIPNFVDQVVVVDNGSSDQTAEIARQRGVEVMHQPLRGYGRACLTGMDNLHANVVVFLDGDCSDHPEQMERLVAPIADDQYDMVIGSRTLGNCEKGALTVQQKFGNGLACKLMRLFFDVHYTDLGPFRAIRHEALKRLEMSDPTYGWTVEMQVKAALLGLRVLEVPVSYRKRIGISKISGTICGVLGAGSKILYTIFREAFARKKKHKNVERLIIFARYPEPGKTKTRLTSLLTPKAAALLYKQLVAIAFAATKALLVYRDVDVEVRSTGSAPQDMAAIFDKNFTYRNQGKGNLGFRLQQAVADTFADGAKRLVIVGTDCPALTCRHLENAFDALLNNDVVLGPAYDGGYYLVGMSGPYSKLFEAMPWSTAALLNQTLERAEELELRVHQLPPLQDIDTPEDLEMLSLQRALTKSIPRLSIIIPTLNEEEHLAATLLSVHQEKDIEVIVVDGGSHDRTVDIAALFDVKVFTSCSGRGLQWNAGVESACCDQLLFLHADTILPTGYFRSVEATLQRKHVAAGVFRIRIDESRRSFRWIERAINWRTSALASAYADQAIFMNKETYVACGGLQNSICMEDCNIIRRLGKQGRISILPIFVTTSAHSWKTHGFVRHFLKYQFLKT